MSATTRPRGELTRPRGRKRGLLLLLMAVLLVGATVAAGQLTDSAMLTPPAPEPVALAEAGSAYCPVIAGEGDTAQLEIASASADTDAEVVITRYVQGQAVRDEPFGLEAGRSVVLELSADQAGSPAVVEWRGAPVVAQTRLSDGDEVAAATCQTQPADRWYLTGFDTTRGSTSTIYLFNPFGQDAVVSLQFGTDEGPVDLVIANQIQVPVGQVVALDLAELRPETPDLAVTVRSEVGRVVAQGQVVRGPAGEGLEGVTGRALLPAVADPSDELFFPEALQDDVTQSWVTVYNPADRPAAVRVQVSTPLGDASTLASELTIPAGATARVELADLSALPRMGIRVISVNGIGLVATRISAIQDGPRTGVAVAVAVPAADVSWTVAGLRGADDSLVLFNPGVEVATARAEVAGTPPEGWAQVQVPPNGVVTLPVTGDAPAGAALVTADKPLVAGAVSVAEGDATAYWSATGTATSRLLGGQDALTAERDPRLSSLPAVSATATPTPVPVTPVPPGEGELDEPADPVIIPEPTVTPTTSPGAEPPPEPAAPPPPPPPAATDAAPEPGDQPGPTPEPGVTATEEGDLFGQAGGPDADARS
ncbi:hypothetical protein BH23ACT9_BH23ACT9_27090 [soil metagenome]